MRYYIATHVCKDRDWAQYYIEHRVNHHDNHTWTFTSSTDVIADATAFSTKKEAEKMRDAAYVNPVGAHGTKSNSMVVGIDDKELFKIILSRGTRGWIGQI